jgi:DNA-directed RNA polymerase II subunit RPB11
MLRAHLLKDPHVAFAGYKSQLPSTFTPRQLLTCKLVPHPLFATFELRVQTDGTITPKEALVNCCKNLVGDLQTLSREFTKEYELRKMVGGDAAVADK